MHIAFLSIMYACALYESFDPHYIYVYQINPYVADFWLKDMFTFQLLVHTYHGSFYALKVLHTHGCGTTPQLVLPALSYFNSIGKFLIHYCASYGINFSLTDIQLLIKDISISVLCIAQHLVVLSLHHTHTYVVAWYQIDSHHRTIQLLVKGGICIKF